MKTGTELLQTREAANTSPVYDTANEILLAVRDAVGGKLSYRFEDYKTSIVETKLFLGIGGYTQVLDITPNEGGKFSTLKEENLVYGQPGPYFRIPGNLAGLSGNYANLTIEVWVKSTFKPF